MRTIMLLTIRWIGEVTTWTWMQTSKLVVDDTDYGLCAGDLRPGYCSMMLILSIDV